MPVNVASTKRSAAFSDRFVYQTIVSSNSSSASGWSSNPVSTQPLVGVRNDLVAWNHLDAAAVYVIEAAADFGFPGFVVALFGFGGDGVEEELGEGEAVLVAELTGHFVDGIHSGGDLRHRVEYSRSVSPGRGASP